MHTHNIKQHKRKSAGPLIRTLLNTFILLFMAPFLSGAGAPMLLSGCLVSLLPCVAGDGRKPARHLRMVLKKKGLTAPGVRGRVSSKIQIDPKHLRMCQVACVMFVCVVVGCFFDFAKNE